MSGIGSKLGSHLRELTLAECLVVVAIVGVTVAILLPGVKWASSGSIRAPVRVFVFDATQGEPIANAEAGIFRAPPFSGTDPPEQDREHFTSLSFGHVHDHDRATTDSHGNAVIEYEFRTGASHERPAAHAHTRWAWVYIEAKGYGRVVVPVRHDSLPTARVRELKELLVPVGLLPVE